MACSVKICRNLKRFRPDGVSFYRFPRDENMRKKWFAALNIDKPLNWVTDQKFVCSNHFVKGSTTHAGRLKFNAVPTLNLNSDCSAASSTESTTPPEEDGGVDFIIDIRMGSGESDQNSPPVREGTLLKRKRGNIIVQSDSSSPDILVKTLHSVILQRDQARTKLYQANKMIKNLKSRSFSDVSLVDDEDEVPNLLMNRYLKHLELGSASKDAYHEKLYQFAETLHSCSPQAYELVRGVFAQALPEPFELLKTSTEEAASIKLEI